MNQMFNIFLGGIILIILGVFYLFYLKPKNQMKRYQKAFREKGYKVKILPLAFMNDRWTSDMAQNAKQFGNPFFPYQDLNQDIVLANSLHKVVIVICKSKLVKEISNNLISFPKSPIIKENFSRLSRNEGLVFVEGEVWKRKRKILSHMFNHDLLVSLIPKLVQEVKIQFSKLDQDRAVREKVNLRFHFISILGNFLTKQFLGGEIGKFEHNGKNFSEFFQLYSKELFHQSFSPRCLLFGRKFLKLGIFQEDRKLEEKQKIIQTVIKESIEKEIQKYQSATSKQDHNFITYLLEKGFLNKEKSLDQYDIQQFASEYGILYFAGIETTSVLLNSMLMKVSEHQSLQEKLYKQIDELDKSEKTPQIEALMNETLRTCPPLPVMFPREVIQQTTLDSVKINPGTQVYLNIYAIQHKSENFENPQLFNCERWQEADFKVNPFTFFSFGVGARNCIGKTLGLMQAKTILIQFLKRYQYKAANPKLSQKAQITLSFTNEEYFVSSRS